MNHRSRRNFTGLAVATAATLLGTPAFAQSFFTSSADYFNAISGFQQNNLGFETGGEEGDSINEGDTLNGVTFTDLPSDTLGRLTGQFNKFGDFSLALYRGIDSEAFDESFFFPGESFSVSFAQPINAIGIFFNANPNPDNQFFIQTMVGTAFTGAGQSYDQDTFFFAGIVSDTPFTAATIGATEPFQGDGIRPFANQGFNADNLNFSVGSVSAVPEPGAYALMGMGAFGLGCVALRYRKRG